jgi:hypothetical protein
VLAEAEGTRVQGQPGLHSETLSKKEKKKKEQFFHSCVLVQVQQCFPIVKTYFSLSCEVLGLVRGGWTQKTYLRTL